MMILLGRIPGHRRARRDLRRRLLSRQPPWSRRRGRLHRLGPIHLLLGVLLVVAGLGVLSGPGGSHARRHPCRAQRAGEPGLHRSLSVLEHPDHHRRHPRDLRTDRARPGTPRQVTLPRTCAGPDVRSTRARHVDDDDDDEKPDHASGTHRPPATRVRHVAPSGRARPGPCAPMGHGTGGRRARVDGRRRMRPGGASWLVGAVT